MSWKGNVGLQLTRAKSRLLSMNLSQWSVLFLTGLLLLLLSLPTSDKKTEGEEDAGFSKSDFFQIEGDAEEKQSQERSKTELEERLEQVLAQVFGVGKVDALVMTEEKRMDSFSNVSPQVTGVLVVAEGADNPVIVQNIKDACESLFQLEPHKIKIMKMK